MRFELIQSLRPELTLTPQLILNLKILQLPTLELEQLIRSELEQNPALELVEEEPEAGSGEDGLPETAPETSSGDSETGDFAPDQAGLEGVTPKDDYSIDELLPDEAGPVSPTALTGQEEDDVLPVELAAGPDQDLRAALLPRLQNALSTEDAAIAETVIEWLNEDGFLTVSEEELAGMLGVELERLKSILHLIQRIPPGGIGCHDTREALLVQLELAGYPEGSLERKLLADHWELLKHKQTARVARLCGVSEQKIREAIQNILLLEPRPARQFTGTVPSYVAPDFSVEWQESRLVVVPNEDNLPRLRLSRRYIEILRDPKAYPREQVEFARKKFQAALMFLRAIESRRRTVRNLVEMILKEQQDFFLQGPEFLKPATLKQAAEKLGVHPSTVSRAIAGKFIETEFGIFPLKHFFKAGTGTTARTSIKEKIHDLIEAEDKKRPYSDEEICARLKEQGIVISRRTVAKYRAELGIPGCNERKAF
ncbi:MAG: RNA polymerase factor sigma-54 [candidate division WOR-3 bacterium]